MIRSVALAHPILPVVCVIVLAGLGYSVASSGDAPSVMAAAIAVIQLGSMPWLVSIGLYWHREVLGAQPTGARILASLALLSCIAAPLAYYFAVAPGTAAGIRMLSFLCIAILPATNLWALWFSSRALAAKRIGSAPKLDAHLLLAFLLGVLLCLPSVSAAIALRSSRQSPGPRTSV